MPLTEAEELELLELEEAESRSRQTGKPQTPKAPASALENLESITREDIQRRGVGGKPGERPAEPPGLGQQVLQNLYGVPVLAGGAKLASLLSRGSRVAPYAERFAQTVIPSTGKELARTAGAVTTGTAAAYGAGQLLPPGASPVVRQLTEFGAGTLGELPVAAGRQVAKAFRPLTDRGVQEAAGRVVRQMEPGQIEQLPEFAPSRRDIVAQMQARLRGGKTAEEPIDVGRVSEILGTKASGMRASGEALAKQLEATSRSRVAELIKPKTPQEVGEVARALADERLNKLKADRETIVKKDKDQMFQIARAKEEAGQGIETTETFAQAKDILKNMLVDSLTKRVNLTGPEAAAVAEVRRDLTGTILDPMTGEVSQKKLSFQALENLRRRLGDRAAGAPATGYEAIGQQQAGELKKLVESVMNDFTDGALKKYTDNYSKASEPINKYLSKVGQVLTGKNEFPLETFKVDEEVIGKKVFSSERQVQDFIDLIGGDVKKAEELARNYASFVLQDAQPDKIIQFANQGWLKKFPALKDDLIRFGNLQRSTPATAQKIRQVTAATAAPLELGRTERDQAENFKALLLGPSNSQAVRDAAQILSRTPEGSEAFKTAVKDVIGLTPAGSLQAAYRDKLRPAMQNSGLYQPNELAVIDDAVRGIVNVQGAVERSVRRVSALPGAESQSQELTRLIQSEVAQMRSGSIFGAAMAGLLSAGASSLLNISPTLGGVGGAAAGAVGATLLPRYRNYAANIREQVSNIVRDPQKMKQITEASPEQRVGLIQGMIRAGLYSATIAESGE